MLPEAFPYQLKVRDFFRSHASTWEFFAAERIREEQLAAFQTDLLKNAHPFSREEEPGLFEKIDRARAALELPDLRVTAYQAPDSQGNGLNVRIVYHPQEARLLLMGPILEKPDEPEMLAFIVHELALVRLYTLMNGEVEIASRIIASIVNHPQSDRVYLETARLFSLYTEIYCDRCAYTVMGDPTPVTSMLLKPAKGRTAGSAGRTAGIGVCELRTRALDLWHSQGEAAMPAITKMVEGVPDLDHLDLFVQRELDDLTYDFLREYLRPEWMRTELIDGLHLQYFPGGAVRAGGPEGGIREVRPPEKVAAAIAGLHPDIRSYFGHVLLDFCLADPSLKDMLSVRALEFAGEMQLSEVYDAICKKELAPKD
jgi:hypothetical protein